MSTLSENIEQAISDFSSIKNAIEEKGINIPAGTPTSQYGAKIASIPSGNTTYIDDYTISNNVLTEGSISFTNDITANIPDGVTTLGGGAFDDDPFITRVVMPNTVTTIEDADIPNGKYGCFHNCRNLSSVIFSETLTYIGSQALMECPKLTSIVIPVSVTEIGAFAFFSAGAYGLTDIYYAGTQEEWEAITGLEDARIPTGCTIHYEYEPE